MDKIVRIPRKIKKREKKLFCPGTILVCFDKRGDIKSSRRYYIEAI